MKALTLALALVACGGSAPAPRDPAQLAADAHRTSLAACRAYHAAVALGAKPNDAADAACEAAQGLCGNGD